MALTRDYQVTVLERIRRDPEFTAALYAEAIASLIEGDKATTLSILRDLVHAHISFKQLSEQTGFGEKTLHRMLGANGNPTSENLAQIIHTVERDLNLVTEVTARRVKGKGVNHKPVMAYA
jgi:DNA-binding phage protein